MNHPRRLRRLDTLHSVNRFLFFLTICTANRRPLLAKRDIHLSFLEYCASSVDKADVWVGRYVLMPDHLHVFISAGSSAAVSRWVGSLKKSLAAGWRRKGLSAPFWQESFFDHALRHEESYAMKWEYVEMNPVRAGLVSSAKEWPFAGEVHSIPWL
jgi:REP element-mobilizing transposase RayT